MTTDQFRKLLMYRDQAISKAGFAMHIYSREIYQQLRGAKEEADIDRRIAQMVEAKPEWLK